MHSYPTSSCQDIVKVSVAIANGSGFQLTYLLSWLLRRVAKRSTEHGPRVQIKLRQIDLPRTHSADDCSVLDSPCTMEFITPGRCTADRVIPAGGTSAIDRRLPGIGSETSCLPSC